MRDYINKVREKPIHVRERVALAWTAGLSLLVIFFWVTIVRFEFLPEERLAETRSPIETLGSAFKSAYKGSVAAVSESIGASRPPEGEGKLIVVPDKNPPIAEEEKKDPREDGPKAPSPFPVSFEEADSAGVAPYTPPTDSSGI